MKQKAKLVTGLIIGFLAAIGLDQWTKLLAVNHLMDRPAYVIWDGVFEFLYSENRGAAFGMLQGKQWFFLIIAVIVVAAAVYSISRMPATKKYLPLHLIAMFLSAGAVGNMIDRFTRGYVVDFLELAFVRFAVFNVADVCICLGAGLAIIGPIVDELRKEQAHGK